MANEVKKPYPWASVSVLIGLTEFDISAENGEPTEYTVSRYASKEAVEAGDMSSSANVSRKDFLAMLEVARVAATLPPGDTGEKESE